MYNTSAYIPTYVYIMCVLHFIDKTEVLHHHTLTTYVLYIMSSITL